MMRAKREIDSWGRYLEAERSGAEREAEQALTVLFRLLPVIAAPAGFSGRVLARIGGRSLFVRPSVRWAIAATLVAVAVGAAAFGPMLPALAALVGPGKVLGGGVELLSAFAVQFASGVAFWQQIVALGSTIGRSLLHPSVFVLLVVQLALAAAAVRGLARLVPSHRSSNHVAR